MSWLFRKPKADPREMVAVQFGYGHKVVPVERDADGRPIAWVYDQCIRLDKPGYRDVIWLKRLPASALEGK